MSSFDMYIFWQAQVGPESLSLPEPLLSLKSKPGEYVKQPFRGKTQYTVIDS